MVDFFHQSVFGDDFFAAFRDGKTVGKIGDETDGPDVPDDFKPWSVDMIQDDDHPVDDRRKNPDPKEEEAGRLFVRGGDLVWHTLGIYHNHVCSAFMFSKNYSSRNFTVPV